MSKRQETKNVLSQLLSNIDEIALKKTSNRMMVAAKISNALKNKGISQKEFAKMLRKSESEISSWLSGDRNFTIDTLTEVSEALDIIARYRGTNHLLILGSYSPAWKETGCKCGYLGSLQLGM